MFFRVRASLTERPGALALLATRCGDAGLNILGLQIFPDLGRVTDELVISAPEDWTAGAVAELVSGAGGDEVSVEPCTTHDLIDQPTRWLTAAHDVVNDPGTAADGDREAARCASREVERDRALPCRGAAHPGGVARRQHGDHPRSAPVEYDETASGVVARIGGHVVGVAAFALTTGRELTVEVAPAWRRLGIGSTLLTRAASQAAAAGEAEIVLLSPADDEGFVSMLCSAGLRARIKVTDGLLQARIVVSGVRRPSGLTVVPGEDPAATGS